MNRPLRVALLITDDREQHKAYGVAQPYFGTAVTALLRGFAELDDVEFDIVSCVRQRVTSTVQVARNIRYHAVQVPKVGWISTAYQGCIRAVRRKLREFQPDIVHGQGTERDCAVCAVFSGYPNVVTIHGNMAKMAEITGARPFSFGWLNARLENFTLPRTDGVLCNSAHTEALVRPRASRTWRVANPLRPPFFQPIPSSSRQPLRFLNIGFVSPWKRQLEILELAERLQREGLDAEFEFVGQCDGGSRYQQAFLDRISRLKFARWCGQESAEELVSHLDRASALLHFPTEEAFGLVVAEALARNLKVFGSRVGGIPDITAGESEAELTDAHDWDGLGQAIVRWAGAGAPRPVNAAAEMEARFHPRVIARRHIEIYREVLSTRT